MDGARSPSVIGSSNGRSASVVAMPTVAMVAAGCRAMKLRRVRRGCGAEFGVRAIAALSTVVVSLTGEIAKRVDRSDSPDRVSRAEPVGARCACTEGVTTANVSVAIAATGSRTQATCGAA